MNDRKRKDEEPFLNLIDRNIGILIKISNFYAHTKHDREDLINDIVFELWKSFDKFKGGSSISTWIYRVALNTSMNYARKYKRDSIFSLGMQDRDFKGDSWIIEQRDESLQAIMYKSIEELNGLDKALVLLYLDSKSYEGIAQITGISKTNVGTKLSRIKEYLKNICNT